MADQNNEFTTDELEAPSWLNTQFLEQVLSKHEGDEQLAVKTIKVSPATLKGDHYASIMFRVVVEYTNKQGNASKSLIVKTMPQVEGFKKEQLNESHIFRTEIGMYTEVLPKFEAVLREAGDNTSLCVPCIYHSLEPQQVMIFDDLVPLGYIVVRDREPTMDEVRLAFSKLAKWHAVSFKMIKDQPEVFQKFKYSLMELPKITEDPFMYGIDFFIRMLDEVPDLKGYKPSLERIRENLVENFRAPFVEHRENRQDDAYYVLCHGDLYIRNMMFKHDKVTNVAEDCMLIDFQMSNVGPMPNDIIYATYQMLSPDQRQNHLEELIRFYFSIFTDTLKKINYKGESPLLETFQQQYFRQKHLEIFLLTTFLPLRYYIKSGKQKFDDVTQWRENDELRQNFYRIEGYVEETRNLLKRFAQRGYFD
ncbi:uncharacterized protein LOC133837394 [Drosophila sulfurigaster albostrigata]|uniref:uncharacterized protein LOC133837394 n=1 Tax=Drosophila sulfurigaster albostrigata TaxID=89887 RepID=UPI002D219567|nr:uncharacterized protein LOC133837394 [Drosophila sulfurigaster albostrigata]